MKSRCMPLPPQPGPGLCRMCGKPVPKGSRTWCSHECVEAYKIRAWPGHARKRVWERDRGVCDVCGLDLRAVMKAINRRARRLTYMDAVAVVAGLGVQSRRQNDFQNGRPVRTFRDRFPFSRNKTKTENRIDRLRYHPGVSLGALWQADHRIPVAEGGGSCGLDNLRTLCHWCHTRETAALKRRLAAAKRKQRELF